MNGIRRNAIRLFRFNGIDLSLHWSWFLVAAYEISDRQRAYSSITWNILEYLALFLIVMLHEFGHALACRQVGGIANQIVLWPLGGVAYVNPPQRPGATLWSIAAGPLVNVGLVPILKILGVLMRSQGLSQQMPNAFLLLRTVALINMGLVIFNMLPIYPLDGGQILRSLSLVRHRPRAQFNGGHGHRLSWSGRTHHSRAEDSIRLVWSPVRFYFDVLLEGAATSARASSPGQITAPRRILLPFLQNFPALGRVLALLELQESFRHLSNTSSLSALLDSI
jgi:Zn-dependent protease